LATAARDRRRARHLQGFATADRPADLLQARGGQRRPEDRPRLQARARCAQPCATRRPDSDVGHPRRRRQRGRC
ncbi:MAG: hypothetical protein ACK559_34255, partial [bacterium]